MINPILKKLDETYIYKQSQDYRNDIIRGIYADRLDVTQQSFDGIRYAINHRQMNSVVSKLFANRDIVFIKPAVVMPRALKVFVARDLTVAGSIEQKPLKVFIDVSDIISQNNDGDYQITYIDKLISYLINAMVLLIYNIEPQRLVGNSSLVEYSTICFAKLFTYIVDYLYKISNTDINRDMCYHLSAMYYLINICKKDPIKEEDNIRSYASKVSKLNSRQVDIVMMYIDETTFTNIKFFIATVAKMLKIEKLSLDAFMAKWLHVYGTGTQFALEYYPAFSSMLTNAYVGSYINNQKVIEKILGKDLVTYSTRVVSTGGGLLE